MTRSLDVAIIDYGMGNLRSVQNAMMTIFPDKAIRTTSSAGEILHAERVVFPGQGALPDCMRELQKLHLIDTVLAVSRDKPFLGICLGLQVLFEHSDEGNVDALGILSGSVCRFDENRLNKDATRRKVPHMGWNEVHQVRPHALWKDIADQTRFYHVHSYYVLPDNDAVVVGTADYVEQFTSAVAVDNIFAVQFHPEKSATSGLQLLRNFMSWQP